MKIMLKTCLCSTYSNVEIIAYSNYGRQHVTKLKDHFTKPQLHKTVTYRDTIISSNITPRKIKIKITDLCYQQAAQGL